MKNTFKLFGIIALAVIIGFGVTACDSDDDNGGNGGGGNSVTIKIVNEGSQTASYVMLNDFVDNKIFENTNANIAAGSEKSFTISNYNPDVSYRVLVGTGSAFGSYGYTMLFHKLTEGKTFVWDGTNFDGSVTLKDENNNSGNGGTSWSFKIINQSNEDCAQVRIFPGTAASSGYAASLWQLNVTAAAGTTSQVYSSTANIGTSVKFAGRNNDSMYTIRSNALTLTAGNTYVLTITNWDDYDSNSLSVTVE